ncbi:hypothetical protein S245_049719, partial [Arachis hypogaea]
STFFTAPLSKYCKNFEYVNLVEVEDLGLSGSAALAGLAEDKDSSSHVGGNPITDGFNSFLLLSLVSNKGCNGHVLFSLFFFLFLFYSIFSHTYITINFKLYIIL